MYTEQKKKTYSWNPEDWINIEKKKKTEPPKPGRVWTFIARKMQKGKRLREESCRDMRPTQISGETMCDSSGIGVARSLAFL